LTDASSLNWLDNGRRLLLAYSMAIVPLIMILLKIVVIRRYSQSWVPVLIVREHHTSSGIPNIIVSLSVPTLALPTPFIFASLHITSHVVAAAMFFGQAMAIGTCLEFFIAMLFVQLSNDIIIRNLNVAALSFVHSQLAFEANHGIAFTALDLGSRRIRCADPFLTFWFRTYYHQRVFLIIDVIFELLIPLENFWTILEDNF
jgi:hypothetical protein